MSAPEGLLLKVTGQFDLLTMLAQPVKQSAEANIPMWSSLDICISRPQICSFGTTVNSFTTTGN
jgi:hypothetical protein